MTIERVARPFTQTMAGRFRPVSRTGRERTSRQPATCRTGTPTMPEATARFGQLCPGLSFPNQQPPLGQVIDPNGVCNSEAVLPVPSHVRPAQRRRTSAKRCIMRALGLVGAGPLGGNAPMRRALNLPVTIRKCGCCCYGPILAALFLLAF